VRFAVVAHACSPALARPEPLERIAEEVQSDAALIGECVVVRAPLARCDHIKGKLHRAFEFRHRLLKVEHIGLRGNVFELGDGAKGANAAEEPIGRSNMLKKGLALLHEWSGTEAVL
jgi:hypothetical protein